jgi:hypothetical protein
MEDFMKKSLMLGVVAMLITVWGVYGFDGSPAEVRVAKEVRHELVMLPYYSVLTISHFEWTGELSHCSVKSPGPRSKVMRSGS